MFHLFLKIKDWKYFEFFLWLLTLSSENVENFDGSFSKWVFPWPLHPGSVSGSELQTKHRHSIRSSLQLAPATPWWPTFDQSEGCVLVTWSLSANQRPVSRWCDHQQLTTAETEAPSNDDKLIAFKQIKKKLMEKPFTWHREQELLIGCQMWLELLIGRQSNCWITTPDLTGSCAL